MKTDYLFLLTFAVVAIIFPLIPISLSLLWGRWFYPSRAGAVKTSSYECGVESKSFAGIQFKSHYYLYGLVFLIFDVEIVFLLPFAVAFLEIPIAAFLAMMFFLLLMLEGLVWAWAKGMLEWS